MFRPGRRDGGDDTALPSGITTASSASAASTTPYSTTYYKTLDDGRVVVAITQYDGRPLTDAPVYSYSDSATPTGTTIVSAMPTTIATASSTPASTISSDPFSSSLPLSPGPGSLGPNVDGFWNNFSDGVKAAIVIAIIFGIVCIVIASIWFCCGRPRRRRRKERESLKLDEERERGLARQIAPGASVENLPVPLRAIHSREEREGSGVPPQAQGAQRASLRHSSGHGVARAASRLTRGMSLRGGGMGGIGDAPPRYEEVVPNTHQRVAGGIRQSRTEIEEDDGGMGVVADGKTPLSEIPFEDVVLDPPRSEASSSRDFGERHARSGGDTTGHTNS